MINDNEIEDICPELLNISELDCAFRNLCTQRNDYKKEIMNLFEAKSYFESCLTIIKNFIEPGDNKKIKQINEEHGTHDVLEKYFENLLAIIDSDQSSLELNMGNLKLLNTFSIKMGAKRFREKLKSYQEDLIRSPINDSLEVFNRLKYNFKEGTNEKEVFEYILFCKVFVSAKIKGYPERQKVSKSSGSLGSTFNETNIIKQPKTRLKQGQEVETVNPRPPEIEEEFPDIFESEITDKDN